jgi:hypothetical protein
MRLAFWDAGDPLRLERIRPAAFSALCEASPAEEQPVFAGILLRQHFRLFQHNPPRAALPARSRLAPWPTPGSLVQKVEELFDLSKRSLVPF